MTTSAKHREPSQFVKAFYRLAQRFVVLDITKLLVKEADDGVNVSPKGSLECRRLSPEELLAASKDPALGIEADMVARIQSGLDECVAAMDQDQVAGYLWVARQGIEAEHNCGNHPLTGVAASYEADTAFIYKVFSLASYRGRRIFPALACYTAEMLKREEGITRLVSTTDWTNAAALAGFRRAGFNSIGNVYRFAFGKPITYVPAQTKSLKISLGKDAVVPKRVSIA